MEYVPGSDPGATAITQPIRLTDNGLWLGQSELEAARAS